MVVLVPVVAVAGRGVTRLPMRAKHGEGVVRRCRLHRCDGREELHPDRKDANEKTTQWEATHDPGQTAEAGRPA